MVIGKFYGGIAALVWSPETDRYLLLRRSADKDYAAGVWECVTGRVDQGEGFEDALQREVSEELGVAARVELILGTTHFYRGAPHPDNELIGIVCLCSLENPQAIRISAEHSEHRWLSAGEAFELLQAGDPSTQWMRRVLQRAEEMKALAPQGLRDLFRHGGFELG
jgi:8-oxo-dGTP pyrophosphatase MutT (NUDIX family)